MKMFYMNTSSLGHSPDSSIIPEPPIRTRTPLELHLITETSPIGRLTVQPQIQEVTVAEVVLHDGHERGHLAEQQDAVARGLQLREDPVQELKLP